MVNFKLRAKHYLNMINAQQRLLSTKISEVQTQVEDPLFGNLFTTTYQEMTAQESENDAERMIDVTGGRSFVQGGDVASMQIYTTQFIKVLTQIMHRGK